jgi:hypothetical protein
MGIQLGQNLCCHISRESIENANLGRKADQFPQKVVKETADSLPGNILEDTKDTGALIGPQTS